MLSVVVHLLMIVCLYSVLMVVFAVTALVVNHDWFLVPVMFGERMSLCTRVKLVTYCRIRSAERNTKLSGEIPSSRLVVGGSMSHPKSMSLWLIHAFGRTGKVLLKNLLFAKSGWKVKLHLLMSSSGIAHKLREGCPTTHAHCMCNIKNYLCKRRPRVSAGPRNLPIHIRPFHRASNSMQLKIC